MVQGDIAQQQIGMSKVKISYNKPGTPNKYRCDNCKVTHVKLWREYQTQFPNLLCCDCAAKGQKKDISGIGLDGYRPSEYGRTCQIGWYVPAIPDEEGLGYWGYTSVPQEGIDWWQALPTRG
jgi:hypothetical protein